jgi:hypothetical protein
LTRYTLPVLYSFLHDGLCSTHLIYLIFVTMKEYFIQ